MEEWSEVYRINTISCFLAIKYAGRHMTAQGYGSIILTSSAASLRANAGAISYSASKAAVNNLAQTAANAFAGTGVRVNAVLPGLVETQLTRKVFEDARARGVEAKLGHVTPMKRPGRPEEVAAVCAFLASEAASYVTGQTIGANGGSGLPRGRVLWSLRRGGFAAAAECFALLRAFGGLTSSYRARPVRAAGGPPQVPRGPSSQPGRPRRSSKAATPLHSSGPALRPGSRRGFACRATSVSSGFHGDGNPHHSGRRRTHSPRPDPARTVVSTAAGAGAHAGRDWLAGVVGRRGRVLHRWIRRRGRILCSRRRSPGRRGGRPSLSKCSQCDQTETDSE